MTRRPIIFEMDAASSNNIWFGEEKGRLTYVYKNSMLFDTLLIYFTIARALCATEAIENSTGHCTCQGQLEISHARMPH